jgi:Putative antitoxin of bacterial toxin-antitoxin system, YdaS/YdaT
MATAAAPIDLARAVKAYGGFTKLAQRLGLTLSTVHGWHIRRKIPEWRLPQLMAAANEDGHDITKIPRKPRKRRVRQ